MYCLRFNVDITMTDYLVYKIALTNHKFLRGRDLQGGGINCLHNAAMCVLIELGNFPVLVSAFPPQHTFPNGVESVDR